MLEDGPEDRVDLGLRFELLQLAAHCCGDRWLMAMETYLAGIADPAL